ncbi:MAG: polyprenyl synthetase family protein [Methanotrichaceae archaeon]|nr:polyprenyl synthetase family protein [Methanotrichaceae archaeon]
MDTSFENGLRSIFQSSTQYTAQIGDYILSSGGKRLRPKLVMLTGRAIGLETEAVMPLAYTVELMHTASLLHDDVVDSTEMRRAKPTANQVFGDKPALLAGDFITASAMETICGLGSMELITGMARTIRRMSEGELKELQYAKDFHDDMDAYLDIIYLKTATLFEFCTYAPGIIAKLSQDTLDALTTYGRAVGMAFQIVDDIINLAPSMDDDKDPYNDILEGKSTLPLLIIFRETPGILAGVSNLPDPEEKKQYLIPFITREILNKSRETARAYLEEAMQAIRNTGFITAELARIPEAIMSQLDNRF